MALEILEGGLLRFGVGYFGGVRRFSITRGGLLRGGLLQGYFHHRLGWVTSLQRHTNMDTDGDPNADVLGNIGHFFARAAIFSKALNSKLVICRLDGAAPLCSLFLLIYFRIL